MRELLSILIIPNYIIVFHFSNILGACKILIIFEIIFEFQLGTCIRRWLMQR